MATIDELRARAELIAEEQQIGGNTAERVGEAFDMVADIIEAVAPGDEQAVLYNPQSPNEAQKAQARANIGAQETISDIADYVKVSAQTFTAAQKAQARENIGAEQAGGAVKNLAGSASDTETRIKAANNPNLQANVHLSGNNIYVNGIAGGIDLDNNGVNIKSGNSGYPNAKVKINGEEVATKVYVDGKVDDRATSIEDALALIEAVIPSQASAQNQLADKTFVNSSISSSTANFVGTFDSLAELQAVQNPTNNDYGFVIETDAVGNEYYDRYKYNGTAWLFEYKVESTPFTADQWAAIQSGITSTLVTKLSALPTNAELTTSLNAKADKSDTYTKAQVDAAIAAIDVSSQIAGKADKVANAVNGDFAALDANGNLTDSGKKASDFGTAQDIAELRSAYASLTQSDIVVVADHTAVVSPEINAIYREFGTTSYSDWMYYDGAWVKMAEYDNAIDDVPVDGSGNLVKSGGVYAELYGGEAYDLPSGLTELNWQTSTARKIYYADGALTFYANTVQGCNIGQAATDGWTNNANWKVVDSAFWLGDEPLVVKVHYNLSQAIDIRVYVKRGESGSLGFAPYRIEAGEGVEMIDLKSFLKAYAPTGYTGITHITFGGMYAVETPYGENQIDIYGFEREFKGMYDLITDLSDEISQGIGALNRDMLAAINGRFFERPFYGHCFISQISASSTPLIPCQSLMDVDAAKRLGFESIELNVQRTSDNQLIAIHGVSGTFGGQVYHINNVDISSTMINSVTYDYIRQYVRYRAMYAKDRVTIPLLSDVLKECKRLGISVVITYSEDARALADKYIGENRWIAYGGLRGNGYGGMIMNYSPLATQTEIVELCESIKPPYVHALNTTAFATFRAAGTLQELADAVHATGCLLGLASCYHSTDDNIYFFENGGDVGASDNFVNFPESGNLVNANGAVDFSDFAHTGSVVDGVLSLPADGTLTLATQPDTVYLGKGSLEIRFNGSLKIVSFGRSTANTIITSDGKLKSLSTYFQNAAPTFSIVATESTDIYMIHYKASKC